MTDTKCKYCLGFGFWPIGTLMPMGPVDAQEWGNRTIKCPYCGKGFVDKGERFESLKKAKESKLK